MPPFGIYVHVPFCATRCGYCDFNTYTADQLNGASRASYAATAIAELERAARALDDSPVVSTVFFGGGTPSLLPPGDISRILDAVNELFGLSPDAEVTSEANPESATAEWLEGVAAAGVNRVSLGMQSARPHVLAALDRVHTPGRVGEAVAAARAAGIGQVSVDLIYGAPGESDADWQASLDAALGYGPDHVSAYSLIVEDGTRLAAQIQRGELPAPDDDVLADRYLMAEAALSAAGLGWYELSNWGEPCRHNLGYWRSADWWGIGPGAHSHVGGVRWWNVKHPATWSSRLAAGESPAQDREVLDEETRRVERVLLQLRLAGGLPMSELRAAGRAAARELAGDGLLELAGGRVVLTLRGRLLADAVTRRLVD